LYDSRKAKREDRMGRFIEGVDRRQSTLLPEAIDDYVGEDNAVRVVDAFVDALDLAREECVNHKCNYGKEDL
jgi:transposase